MTPRACKFDSGPVQLEQSIAPALLLGMAAFLTNFDVTAFVIVLPVVACELGFGVARCLGHRWPQLDADSLFALCGGMGGTGDGGPCLLAMVFLRSRPWRAGRLRWTDVACSRALQGVGAAFIVTRAIALIANVYTQATERTRAFAWLGVISVRMNVRSHEQTFTFPSSQVRIEPSVAFAI